MNMKEYKSKLAGFVRSAKNNREMVQALIIAGLQHLEQHEDTIYLTLLMQKAVGVKSVPTRTIKGYIQAHANLKLEKAKDGQLVFKKINKDTPFDVKVPEVSWYNWEGATHQATPDMDVVSQVKSLMTRIQKNLEEGKVKDTDKATIALADLTALSATLAA